MNDPYERIVIHNGYGELEKKPLLTLPGDVGSNAPALCPGRTILARAEELAESFDKKEVDFPALFAAFTSPDLHANWTWNGSRGRSNYHGLLDGTTGTMLEGECKHFVKNLYLLARAPGPYGLHMDASEISIVEYDGDPARHAGFVSKHAGTFLTLGANIRGQSLYNWGNHKVLLYAGVYWDPCYVKQYHQLTDMAEYLGTGRMLTQDGSPMSLAYTGPKYEEFRKNGRLHYFRQQPGNQQYEGPFSETDLEMIRTQQRGVSVNR